MIVIDQEVLFDPFKDITGFSSDMNRGKWVIGKVVYVNYANKWFSVEYGERRKRISFKFSQIGKDVEECGD